MTVTQAELKAVRRELADVRQQHETDLAKVHRRLLYFAQQYDGMVSSWFRLNEFTGNPIESENQNVGTISGAVWGVDADGIHLRFDGVDDSVDWGATTDHHTGITNEATWDVVCKPLSADTTLPQSIGVLLDKGSDDALPNYTVRLETYLPTADLYGRGGVGVLSDAVYYASHTPAVPAGQLNHIRLTYDGPNKLVSLFQNDMSAAVATAATSTSNNLANNTSWSLLFGKDTAASANDYFFGNIYEVMISSTIRTGQILPI